MPQNNKAITNINRISVPLERYRNTIERRLHTLINGHKPALVYDPIRYVLGSGGKRLRAILVLLSCKAVGGRVSSALNAAAAIEMLHNFTLVHDDIMDNASLRRGRKTVHIKWNDAVAILSGDQLLAHAYRSLLQTKSPQLSKIVDVYTDAFITVCEGQGLDLEFESRRNVTVQEYLIMIEKKTSRVIAAAAEIGALVGGGTHRQVAAMRTFGKEIGLAFQIQDDYLDIAGATAEFGKNIGGDIIEGKKTFLLLAARWKAQGNDKRIIDAVITKRAGSLTRNGGRAALVESMKAVYERTGALKQAKMEIARHTRRAQEALRKLPDTPARALLHALADDLLARSS